MAAVRGCLDGYFKLLEYTRLPSTSCNTTPAQADPQFPFNAPSNLRIQSLSYRLSTKDHDPSSLCGLKIGDMVLSNDDVALILAEVAFFGDDVAFKLHEVALFYPVIYNVTKDEGNDGIEVPNIQIAISAAQSNVRWMRVLQSGPEEDKFEEEEDPQEEEDDMEVDIEEDVIEVENPIEQEDETVPASVHEVGESSTAPFLREDSDGLLPSLMRRDINSLFGRMASLSRRLCGRETAHALVEKKGKAKDEYYGKFILDLCNKVRSSVEQGTAAIEKLVEKLGNAKDKVECKKLKKELEEARIMPLKSAPLTQAAIRQMIKESVDAAIAAERARHANVGNDARGSRPVRGQDTTPTIREYTFARFMKCNPTAFHGTCWELKSFYKIMLLKNLVLIKSYIQLQDYALWDIIEEGNSFKPVARTTTNEDGTSTTTIPGAVTAEQKILKKNDLKARSILMMTLPSEHLLTFNKHKDAKSLFEAIEARFSGNEATKKTQKTLLKQMYETFNDSSSESLDSIFNRLQKIVSQLTILGEIITPEELNLKFLRSLPTEWGMHVVVWRNKSDLGSISFDDLYNNFKIVKPEVKRSVISSSNSGSQNLAFLLGHSSTNDVNTANVHVSTGSTPVSTASTNNSTACLSDATLYAYLATQPNGSQVVREDLEQIHEDDLDEIDLKWQLALLSMKAIKFYQRTGKKIIINGSDTAGYDKKKVRIKQKLQENGQNRRNTDTGNGRANKSRENAIKS
ncbi:hypothetical protein Tco_0680373 [Tanacetum coccineum]|uniref:Uncharacterized protein n=1 Tax=Tanacetum coccineum TaxID=301880 RepID=A0ABQ4XKC1_9ASTR